MARDIDITQLGFIPTGVARRLERIEVRTARQMFHRLKAGRDALREYLNVNPKTFDRIEAGLEDVMEREFPSEIVARITPEVSTRGVAVHRADPSETYYDDDVYVPPRHRH